MGTLDDRHDPAALIEVKVRRRNFTRHSLATRFGVDQARRGWLEPDDVLNARPLDELRKMLMR